MVQPADKADVVNSQAPQTLVLPSRGTAGARSTTAQAQARVSQAEAALAFPKAYTRARKGRNTTPASLPSSDTDAHTAPPSRINGKGHQPLHRASQPAGAPSQSQAAGEFVYAGQQRLPGAGGQGSGPVKASGFADLLEAVLSSPDPMFSPEPAQEMPAVKLGLAPALRGPGPPVLGGVTNVQVKKADVLAGSAPAGGAAAVHAKHKAETETFSRRSARVQARKEQRKPETMQHSYEQKASSMDLFSAKHQVSSDGNARPRCLSDSCMHSGLVHRSPHNAGSQHKSALNKLKSECVTYMP